LTADLKYEPGGIYPRKRQHSPIKAWHNNRYNAQPLTVSQEERQAYAFATMQRSFNSLLEAYRDAEGYIRNYGETYTGMVCRTLEKSCGALRWSDIVAGDPV